MRDVKFNKDFEYKNEPDETTPDEAENANIGIHNTWYLIQQLENLIDSKNGSNIEITECAEAMLNKLEIEGKSVQDGEPSPNNSIEIKSVGYTNLFNKDDYPTIDGFISADNYTITSSTHKSIYIKVKPNTTYQILNFKLNAALVVGTSEAIPKIGDTITNHVIKNANVYDLSITTSKNDNYLVFMIDPGIEKDISKMIIVEGLDKKSYIPYGKYGLELTITKDDESKTTTFVLNEPLRSLPDGSKDLLYVKGGRLFVERNAKEVVLNGSENWTKDLSNNSYLLQNSSIYGLWATACAYSNRFKYSHTDAYYCRADSFAIDSNHRIIIAIQSISTLEDFKAWLNSNNVIIVAKLVEPVIEDLGEIEMPITFKDKSTITTTDELEPTINLEYVKDTILTDYIEKRLINLMK